MRNWLKRLSGLKASRRAQTTAEYAIIVALVAISSIAIVLIFGNQILALFSAETKQLGGDSGAQTETITVDPSAEKGGLKDF